MAASFAESRQVAERYAAALFALAQEKDVLDTVQQELTAVKQAFIESAALANMAQTAILSRSAQAQGIDAILATAKASALTRQFFQVLAANRRLATLPHVAEAFSRMIAESRNEGQAEVIIAHPLNAAQEKHLKDALKKATGHASVQLRVKEDANILGGVIVTIDGKMLDNSLATKLNKIAASMRA